MSEQFKPEDKDRNSLSALISKEDIAELSVALLKTVKGLGGYAIGSVVDYGQSKASAAMNKGASVATTAVEVGYSGYEKLKHIADGLLPALGDKPSVNKPVVEKINIDDGFVVDSKE